jgi:hypothetical protein
MATNGLQLGSVNVLLNAVIATGAGPAFAMPLSPNVQRGGFIQSMAWQINTTGAPSGLSVTLQGSLDGVNWFSIGSAVTSDTLTVINLANANAGPYAFIRANLTTLTGGTTPSVTVLLTLGTI